MDEQRIRYIITKNARYGDDFPKMPGCFQVQKGEIYVGYSIITWLTALGGIPTMLIPIINAVSFLHDGNERLFYVLAIIYFIHWVIGMTFVIYDICSGKLSGSTSKKLLCFVSALFMVRFIFDALSAWWETRGHMLAMMEAEKLWRRDTMLKLVFWASPVTFLYAYIVLVLGMNASMTIGSYVGTGIFIGQMLGRFMELNHRFIVMFIPMFFCVASVMVTAIQFAPLVLVMPGVAPLAQPVLFAELAAMEYAVAVVLCALLCRVTAGPNALRRCGDVLWIIVISLSVSVYTVVCPASLFAHRRGGWSRYAAMVYYPIFVIRLGVLIAECVFWLRPDTAQGMTNETHMILDLSLFFSRGSC
eukprot:TRINITY_DN5929_c0_g1_i2.p1 TRINITY_DN5929_c0_g1~~TRINITY_DN5929_c0_g1_i2.p1  ORF type:complete len:360 (-),score=63.47 TRINITY_DN5929_c0_g1_i2:22-1101(-)